MAVKKSKEVLKFRFNLARNGFLVTMMKPKEEVACHNVLIYQDLEKWANNVARDLGILTPDKIMKTFVVDSEGKKLDNVIPREVGDVIFTLTANEDEVWVDWKTPELERWTVAKENFVGIVIRLAEVLGFTDGKTTTLEAPIELIAKKEKVIAATEVH